VTGIFSFRKHDLRHPAPDIPAEINAGEIPDPVEPQAFDGLGCGIEREGACPVLFEQFVDLVVGRHTSNNTDMDRRIIS